MNFKIHEEIEDSEEEAIISEEIEEVLEVREAEVLTEVVEEMISKEEVIIIDKMIVLNMISHRLMVM